MSCKLHIQQGEGGRPLPARLCGQPGHHDLGGRSGPTGRQLCPNS